MLLLDSINTTSTPNMQLKLRDVQSPVFNFKLISNKPTNVYMFIIFTKVGDNGPTIKSCLYFFKFSVGDKRKRNMHWYLKKLVQPRRPHLFYLIILLDKQYSAVFSLRYIIRLYVSDVTLPENSFSLYLYYILSLFL